LHPVVEFEIEFVEQIVYADYNLKLFEMVAWTSEPSKKIVKKRLLIFRHYQVDVKEITCPLQWWEKHEVMFFIVNRF
jgi:hypothetical protein